MKSVRIVVAGILIAVALAVTSCAAWLYFDESGLPDVQAMRALAEGADGSVNVACLSGQSVAIPYESLGENTRHALAAAEAPEDSPGVIAAIARNDGRSAAMRLSRRLFCTDEKPLTRDIDEIRTAIQLERKYSKRELFTMLANTAYFDDGIIGVQAASAHYFHKRSSETHPPGVGFTGRASGESGLLLTEESSGSRPLPAQ
jgi:hypothetical protein